MNIHGHCYVLPLAAVGASTTPIPHHPSVLPSNTNINQMNNAQLATQMSCGINPLSMGNNGSGAQANNCSSTLQGSNYTSLSHENPTSKYLVGAQNILPHLLQEQHTHLRQPHQPLIHLNPNHHQLNHALQLQHPHQQSLLSIPYQTNNLQAATLTPTAFHPFFATPSMPRSTSNLSNLSNFSSQHHSPKNVQQIGQVAAASGHQHLEQHNLQNCSATHSDTQHHHHGHQQIQDHLISRHHLHNIPSQTALQTSSDPQIYNPFLTSASLLSASNIIPKAPLLQTPAIGKECNGNNFSGLNKESIVYGTSSVSSGGNVINSIGSNNLINSMNASGQQQRSNTNNTTGKRKLDDTDNKSEVKKAKLETKALKAKRPGFTDERYNETSYYHEPENNLRKVYPYYFTFTTFTKGRWVGERILDVFAREFRAHPATEYERCIKAGTLTVNYEQVTIDYRLKHNDLLANIVHRHEVPVSNENIKIIHIDEDLVVVNKPASIPVHPCGRYRHNTVVFILAKEYGLKNLRTIHRLDRLTSGLLLFGRNPKKSREMEQHIRTRQVKKAYVCRVEGEFPSASVSCKEPIEVVSYKIGVCKVSPNGKECQTDFQRLSFNGKTSVVLCHPKTGRMHQIRVHLQYLGYPVVNDPLYNHEVFGPEKGKYGNIGKTDEQLIQDLISIHNAENWLGMDIESEGGNVLCSGPPDQNDSFSNDISTNNGDDKALRVEASSTTKGVSGTTHFNIEGKDNASKMNDINDQLCHTKTSSGNVNISTSLQSDNVKVNRPETPDSAVDVNSLSASADSPSSSSSTASYSTNQQFQTHSNFSKHSTSTSTSVAMQTPSPNSLEALKLDCMVENKLPLISTSSTDSHLNATSINSTSSSSNGPSSKFTQLQQPEVENKSYSTTIATQTGIEEADELFDTKKLSYDAHCYECKVKYRDPSPKDLVMFLHAYTYTGPDWVFKTELPSWAEENWIDPE